MKSFLLKTCWKIAIHIWGMQKLIHWDCSENITGVEDFRGCPDLAIRQRGAFICSSVQLDFCIVERSMQELFLLFVRLREFYFYGEVEDFFFIFSMSHIKKNLKSSLLTPLGLVCSEGLYI